MKITGYTLFIAVFLAFGLWQPARDFLLSSYDLAPEITVLVGIFYIYIFTVTLYFTIAKNQPARTSFYNLHVKMACSVMVSLGLVGTFLGLVDMIAGIAGALTTEEPDFTKKMAILLGAISGSLAAMSFAFVTSILGVGISAYSMVAATFVASAFKNQELKAKESNKEISNNIEDRICFLEKYYDDLRLTTIEGVLDVITPSIILDEMAKDRSLHNQYQLDSLALLKSIHESIVALNNKLEYNNFATKELTQCVSLINSELASNSIINKDISDGLTFIKNEFQGGVEVIRSISCEYDKIHLLMSSLNEMASDGNSHLLDINCKLSESNVHLLSVIESAENNKKYIETYKKKILEVLM